MAILTLAEIASYLKLPIEYSSAAEILAIPDSEPVSLSYENASEQAVINIVVKDMPGTTTYDLTDDYTISLEDTTTQITRVDGGDIAANELCEITYNYANYKDYKIIENNIDTTEAWIKDYCNNDFLDDDDEDIFPDSHKPQLAKLIYYFAKNNQYQNAISTDIKSKSMSKTSITFKGNDTDGKQALKDLLKEFDDIRRPKYV